MAGTAATASVLGLIVFGTLASLLGKIGKSPTPSEKQQAALFAKIFFQMLQFVCCSLRTLG